MRIRPTVRLLVLDPQQRILLFKFEDAVPLHPALPDLTLYWVTPGGGVDRGETHEQAAIRELWEETGIQVDQVGPWVWNRDRVLRFPDRSVLFRERYYLVPVTTSEVLLTNLLPYERNVYRDHRWWTLDEMERTDEVLLPIGLAGYLRPLLAGNIPAEPITLEA